jgi:1-deoxy-D-xylulose-5-phosphate synthase
MILETINEPNDIKKVNPADYDLLASEIRQFLVEHVSRTGGHLSSNLGVVELTMALHLALNLPEDKLIWDVGHQAYTHKLLSGRKEEFDTLRKYGGLSGFPKRHESSFDSFDTGHSSTSISAGIGYVCARECRQEKYSVVSVIGDGALTGGLALEALNNASMLKSNFIIILNDNEMSIAKNVGAVSSLLSGIRTDEGYNKLKDDVSNALLKIPKIGDKVVDKIKNTKSGIKQLVIPGMQFEVMGITYLGPFDGHDINKLIKAINTARKVKHAVILHVVTKKGKGYLPAEKNPGYFHGVSPFDVKTGKILNKKIKPTYTDVFSRKLCSIADHNKNVAAITAAMPDGTGLSRFAAMYPERFFDVGIAEEHAVTFAAGLAAGGMIPVFAIYSSFLQRAYDQILHDVCIQNLSVKFCIDRAGIVGSDGETHQGIFDLSFLNNIPNMVIMAPKNGTELEMMLEFMISASGPMAIRYPRGTAFDGLTDYHSPVCLGKSEELMSGSEVAILAVGNMVAEAYKLAEALQEKGLAPTLINGRFIKPIDEECISALEKNHSLLVTMEENVVTGGYGETVLRYVNEKSLKLKVLIQALPDKFIAHGSPELLRKNAGLDWESIEKKILEELGR